MNSIILFATGLVTKTKNKLFRIIISSILGALYVVGKYLANNEIYSNIIVQIGLAFAMVYIAFAPRNIKLLFKYVIIFYLTSFVFGGCAYALLYYVRPQEILYNNGILTGTYPLKIAFLGAMVGMIFLSLAFKLIKNRISKNEMFCNVKIRYMEKEIEIRAIIDSGNLLKEPITGASVIVVEKEKLQEIVEKDILDNLENIISGQYEVLSNEYISRFRLIPFSSLGKQNGMLLGFKPDLVEIEFDGILGKKEKVIIGIYDKEISKSRTYSAIVGLDLLEERGSIDEYSRTY